MYEKQISELQLLRSWASQVGLGQARDHIAMAIHAIKKDDEMRSANASAAKKVIEEIRE